MPQLARTLRANASLNCQSRIRASDNLRSRCPESVLERAWALQPDQPGRPVPGTAVALVANGQTDQTDGYTLDGVNKKGFTGATLGGWQLNGILAYRSGMPITITEAGSDLNTGGFTPTRPDRIANGTVANPSRQLWFDPQAFQRVTCNIPGRLDLCHYGSSGVGIISGPAQKNADLSLFKNFNIRETLNLQVRLEAINAFNTPFFGTPNGISFATNNSIKPDGS